MHTIPELSPLFQKYYNIFYVVPSREIQLLFIRQVYPFLLAVVLLLGGLVFQGKQFQRLYEHIKNDK
jgi:hypothetical protein